MSNPFSIFKPKSLDIELSFWDVATICYPEHEYESFHLDWVNLLLSEQEAAIFGPRGSGKSRLACVVFPIYLMLKYPNKDYAIVSATYGQSDWAYEVKNKIINKIVPFLGKDIRGNKWGTNELSISLRTSDSREPNISFCSIESGVEGHHFHGIICDDTVTPLYARTETQRQKFQQFISMSLRPTLHPGGWIKWCGTRYHKEDYYNHLIQIMNIKYSSIKAIENQQSYWSSRWPLSKLEEIRDKEIGSSAFAFQYQNDPSLVRDNNIIDMHLLKIDSRPEDKSRLAHLMLIVDPAVSEKEINDYTSWGICGYTNGDYYFIEVGRNQSTVTENRQLFVDLFLKYNYTTLVIEGVAGFGILKDIMREALPDVNVKLYKPTKDDKVTRYYNIQVLVEQGVVHIPNDEIFIKELSNFPTGSHDDLVDMFTCGLRFLRKKIKNDLFE